MTVSRLPSERLETLIRRLAEELSIDAIGFAPLSVVPIAVQQKYQSWVEAGMHADMSYMERNEGLRFNPQELLLEAKSVIVVAVSYYPKVLQAENSPQVAKYAYGRDYHKVLKPLLAKLADRISKEVAEHTYRLLVDTAPFLERYWAQQCGLGFLGRNQNLILPKRGSFFFLGEILTTLELQSDRQPVERLCGSCKRCIQACPTAALSEEGLDARRCISYLTIEHQGEVEDELACRFGKRFYGCDTCQDICPHNRRPSPTVHFPSKEQILHLSQSNLENLSEEQYASLFYGTATTRAKYKGMCRNARIYIKNNNR